MSGANTQYSWLRLSGYASLAAGVLHAVAAGLHAGHASLVRIFLVMALVQIAWGLIAQHVQHRLFLIAGSLIHLAAMIGWLLSCTTGISFVAGLEIAEAPGPADTTCAALALAALISLMMSQGRIWRNVNDKLVMNGAYALAAISLIGVWNIKEHGHSYNIIKLVDNGLTIDANGVIVSPTTVTTVPNELTATTVTSQNTVAGASTSKSQSPSKKTTTTSSTTTTVAHGHDLTTAQAQALASGWPRTFDPSQPINFSGIGGVTAVQAARATALIQNAARDLARYANYNDAIAAGYLSIGDAGFEHVIKYSYLNDGRFLDTTAPESLVYKVVNGTKTLVSAMFIANPGTQVNDATINDYAGGLIQWHVHDNLCWRPVNGVPKVVGVLDAFGNCPAGSVLQTGGSPMVHVWITPHPCGPFAAVEGVAAGISDVPDSQRVDLCNAAH